MSSISRKEVSKGRKRKVVGRNTQEGKKAEGGTTLDAKSRKCSILKMEFDKVKEAPESYLLPPSEIERVNHRVGFNGLTPNQWALFSKNVWNDLSSPRNKHQLEHGAVFPVKLAERLVSIYSKEGDWVLDPFLGIGTTLIAAQNLKRHGIGIELNPKFARIAEQWLGENKGLFNGEYNGQVVNGDCRKLSEYVEKEKIQVTVTSPPYANFIHRSIEDRTTTHKKSVITHENNSTVKPYSDEIKIVLQANFEVTKAGGYSAWVVKDYRDTKNKIPYVPFHSDLARSGEEVGFKFHDLIIWDQTGQRRLVLLGYPSVFYTNQNCSFIVVFRKQK